MGIPPGEEGKSCSKVPAGRGHDRSVEIYNHQYDVSEHTMIIMSNRLYISIVAIIIVVLS